MRLSVKASLSRPCPEAVATAPAAGTPLQVAHRVQHRKLAPPPAAVGVSAAPAQLRALSPVGHPLLGLAAACPYDEPEATEVVEPARGSLSWWNRRQPATAGAADESP